MRSRVRTAEEVKAAYAASYEKLSLTLGRAVQKIIHSRRSILATRIRLGLGITGKIR
jgi:hypothetical protein